jgi:archaemetzincin
MTLRPFALIFICGAICADAAAADFERPSASAIREALGELEPEPPAFRRLLPPDADFPPIPLPARGDWLATHAESGQTFAEFRASGSNRPDAKRAIIYLQPLGKFPATASPALADLRSYAAAFFQLEAKLLPAVIPRSDQFDPRRNSHTGQRQVRTAPIMEFLRARLPDDAFCLLAVTMEDLYPEPAWNYVFGQASLVERVGVYSFARYDPVFHGGVRERDQPARMLRESCKVLAHETAHMFGLEHCIYFSCVLNGANHLAESAAQPQHLCPVCLRKLQFSSGFDAVKRYETLTAFYRQHGWLDEANWVDRQLAKTRDAGSRTRLVPAATAP